MCTKKTLFTVVLIIICFVPVFSEEINIGGRNGWPGFRTINTRLADDSGLPTIQLSDSEYSVTADVEMLFHFNNGIADSRGLYTVKENHGVRISDTVKKKGTGSGVFSGEGKFLEIIPDDAALFAAGSGRLNDFSIEFWLNPARLSEGENIIRWSGAVNAAGKTLQQDMLCVISNRSMFWEFNNIFLTPKLEGTIFTIESTRSLIPKRWHHHMIRYDSSTGLLEYLIDGIPEDIVYTTAGRKEESEIYSPVIGAAKASHFTIGRGYTGFIDELRITGNVETPDLNKYSMDSGTAVSDIIDLQYYDSRFFNLNAKYRTPGKTQIYYFYRISNEYFRPDSDYPRWNQFSPEEPLPPEVTGRYLQIMAELLPDGTGSNSPILTEIGISYDKNLPPLPPAYVSAAAGDSKVILSWRPVTDPDIAGYKIYYGTKPGMYFGTDALVGASPINAGNVESIEIDGLKNGKLYYFTITSYDNAEKPHESVFFKRN